MSDGVKGRMVETIRKIRVANLRKYKKKPPAPEPEAGKQSDNSAPPEEVAALEAMLGEE